MITLSYDTKQVSLPNPQFGDQRDFTFTELLKQNRYGNTLAVDVERQQHDRYRWEFKDVRESTSEDLELFLIQTLGRVVTLADYTGFTQQVIISLTELPSTSQARGHNNFTLEFITLQHDLDQYGSGFKLEGDNGYLLLEDGSRLLMEDGV